MGSLLLNAILTFFLPELDAILGMIVKNPQSYSNMKADFVKADAIVGTIKASLDQIIAGLK